MTEFTVPLKEHLETLRTADQRFDVERDRRYAEVASEREKALKIKETADLAALELAREIQTYKDEKANELREQINSERGLYATKADLATLEDKLAAQLKPIADFYASQQGGSKVWNYVVGIALTMSGFVIAWLIRSGT